jgi:hypothetical protein
MQYCSEGGCFTAAALARNDDLALAVRGEHSSG